MSPYVRRVAVSMKYLGIDFDRQVISAVGDEEARERTNPVGRVPALILSEEETIIDSAAILDYLDELAGSERALIPVQGVTRRQALYQLALATGAIDRVMGANAERRREEAQHDSERQTRLLRQAKQGFRVLDTELGNNPWFNGDHIGQPDITTAVGVRFFDHVFPGELPGEDVPNLSRLSVQCEELPAFSAAQID